MIGSHGFCPADLHLYDFCLHFPCSKFCNLSHGFKTYGIDNHTCPWILLPDDMQNIRKLPTASPNKYMCRRFQGFQYIRCFPIHRNHICQMKFFQIPAQKLLCCGFLLNGVHTNPRTARCTFHCNRSGTTPHIVYHSIFCQAKFA